MSDKVSNGEIVVSFLLLLLLIWVVAFSIATRNKVVTISEQYDKVNGRVSENETVQDDIKEQQDNILLNLYRDKWVKAIDIASMNDRYDTYTKRIRIGGWDMNEVTLSNPSGDEIIVDIESKVIITNH